MPKQTVQTKRFAKMNQTSKPYTKETERNFLEDDI